MKLDESNLVIDTKDKGKYVLKIMMPDGSRNYLHGLISDSINNLVIERDLLLEQEIYDQDVSIAEEDSYFRLNLSIKDVNGTEHFFHSRKLNINDVIFERMQVSR